MAYKNETEDKEKNDIPDNEHEERAEVDESNGDDAVLEEARRRYQISSKAEIHNANDALEDDNFMAGRNHWPDNIKSQREAEKRPCLTINKLVQFKNQVFNPIRNNTPSIKVRETAGSKTKDFRGASGKKYSQAKVLNGLIKNIEAQSKAKRSYNHATGQAIDGGWGYFRAITEYIEGSFDQEIRIKRIKNRFSVKIDPSTNETDRSDMKFAFISKMMPMKEFQAKWPNAVHNDMDTSTGEALEAWYEDGSVRVAEYYRVVKKDQEIALLSDGRVIELTEKNKSVIDELKTQGITIDKQRTAQKNVVEWRLITGGSVLEKMIEIPCKYIPIPIVIGVEHILDGETVLEGLTRQAKDPVRQYNYWRTAETESVALQPKQPYILGSSQVGEFGSSWSSANDENQSVLIFDDSSNQTPPQRQSPPLASSGHLNAAKAASDDIKSTMGMFDPSIDNRSKEKSGKAILAQDAQAANGNFHYSDNQAEAIEHMARILIDMIPRVYDANRLIRVQFEDGSEDDIELYQNVVDEQTGETVQINDLSMGTFEVEVAIGPSYLTQRQEAVDGLMQFFTAVPRAGQVAADLLAKNLDMPEAEELQRRMRLTAPPGVIEYADDEEQPPAPEPTPEQQADMAKAEATIATAKADEAQAAAKMAEADLAMMELQQGGADQGQASGVSAEEVQQIVADSIQEFISINNN